MDWVDVVMLFIVTLVVLYAINIIGFEMATMLVLLNIGGLLADTAKAVDV